MVFSLCDAVESIERIGRLIAVAEDRSDGFAQG
jgi:hypothetical protein